MTKEFRLPNMEYTSNIDVFISEWDKIKTPFEALGFKVIGFDPGIALCDATTDMGYFNLPMYAAVRILEAINKEEEA